MMLDRLPASISQARGRIKHGTFEGRWHFFFDEYANPKYVYFGVPLRILNDDTCPSVQPGPFIPCAYLYVLEGGPVTLNGQVAF